MLFSPAADGTPFPLLTAERASLRTKESGFGFRPIEDRILYLNAVSLILPQALDRINKNDSASRGLWNSLSSCLGSHLFDETNGDTRWEHWHSTDSVFAAEHFGLIARVKLDHISACLALGKDPAEDTVMAKSDAGFGQNVGKLQRTILGKHKDLLYEILMRCARTELPNYDQRRISLEAADSFSNAFPANLDAPIKLAINEFTTGIRANSAFP